VTAPFVFGGISMTKKNIKIKDFKNIAIEDKANIVDTIVNAYFQTDKDGDIKYTPYFSKVGQIIAAAKYIIDGVIFDDNESIYSTVINDDEVNSLVNNILTLSEFQSCIDLANDIVEYKKAENIARIQNDANSVVAYKILKLMEKEEEKAEKEAETIDNLNCWINEQRELNSLITPELQRDFAKNFNPDSLTDAIIKKYSESDLYKKNQEIIEANRLLRERDGKIIDLENKLKKK